MGPANGDEYCNWDSWTLGGNEGHDYSTDIGTLYTAECGPSEYGPYDWLADSQLVMTQGKWQHVAVTYSAAVYNYYLVTESSF